MKKIYIKTTESCQLKCKHCYIGDNRKQKDFFDEDKTIKWIDQYIKNYDLKQNNILFSFHGGEPFLCSLDKMQKVVDAFPCSLFDATSNLCFPLTKERLDFIKDNFIDKYNTKKSFIKTSWDYKIRFQHEQEQKLWEENIKTLIANNVDIRVVICLTSLLISNVKPRDLIKYLTELEIRNIDFERLTANTTDDKTLIPDYEKQDVWLLEFYELSKNKITVGMFENLKLACNNIFIGCRKRECMQEVITINANGTIGGCPNSSNEHYFTSLNEAPINLCHNYKRDELIQKEKDKNIICYACELYTVCNGDCHQLSWQNNVCPAPKKLIRRINDELETKKRTIISPK